MQDFFKNLNQNLSSAQISEFLSYLSDNKFEAQKIILDKVESLMPDDSNNSIDSIYNFINLLPEKNEFSKYLLDKLIDVYLDNSYFFIKYGKWHLLEIIMDLVNKENVLKNEPMKIKNFIIKSLPLLELKKGDSTEDKEIATDMFLELVLNSEIFKNYKHLVVDFLKNDNDNPYSSYLN